MTQPEEIAKARFKRLSVVRFVGVALALVGAAIIAGKVDLPRIVGVVILGMGLFYALIFPTRLIRRWKAQDENRK
jgi:Kef-type K+ transport system membrane component KefB